MIVREPLTGMYHECSAPFDAMPSPSRTVWRLDLLVTGRWQPQVYLPDQAVATGQMDRLARSLLLAGYAVRLATDDADSATWRWPNGGVRAVREEVDA